ncbi:MAG: metal-sulfur cluster assembly factor [Candidatus Zixiibacteriota bacterium]
MLVNQDIVMGALKEVQDPELRLSVVELGLIYGVDVENEGRNIEVRMTLTSPGCPYGPQLVHEVRDAVSALPGVDTADVRVVWDPPWDPRTMTSDEIKDKLGIW